MARIYLTGSPLMPMVYTVEQPVGVASANRRDDVLLVQFFLRVISDDPTKPQYKLPGLPFQIDGSCGRQTIDYIRNYQQTNSDLNPNSPLVRDGVVDPPRGGHGHGSISHRLYTIFALNNSYMNFRGRQALNDITQDALFPSDLLPSVKIT
jgi:hypothetical protein